MCVLLLWTQISADQHVQTSVEGQMEIQVVCVSSLQKDADRAVVVAVTSHAVFESGPEGGDDVYGVGVASPLLQVKLVFRPCM